MTHFSHTKLAKILALITPGEYSTFGKWLASPWCNSNKKLIVLYKCLHAYHPHFKIEKLTKERLFKKLYPGKTYDDKWMRNIMAAMTKQAEKFMVHMRLEKNKTEYDHMLANDFLERHDIKNYKKTNAKLTDGLEAKKVKSTEDHLLLFRLYDQLYALPESIRNEAAHREVLLKSDHHLDSFYAIQKWRYRIVKAERERLLKDEKHDYGEDNMIECLTKKVNLPVVDLYDKRWGGRNQVVKPENYFTTKNKIFMELDLIPDRDKEIHFSFLQNDAINLWLNGHAEMMEELFHLYKDAFKIDLFIRHGRLPARVYSNFVIAGNNCGMYEEVYGFVENYTHFLSKENQESGQNWALSHACFKKGELQKCVEKLSLIPSFQAHIFNVQSKVLLLQSYFEMCQYNDSYLFPFLDWGDAFLKYLSRDKSIADKSKAALIDFVRLSKSILLWKTKRSRNKIALTEIKNNLENSKNVQARQWLLAHINKMLGEPV